MLAAIAVVVLPAGPLLRDRIVQLGIGERLRGNPAYRNPSALYSVLGAACIAGYIVTGIVSLLGFVASVLVRSVLPLAVASLGSYAAWAFSWPRRGQWLHWAWLAKVGREDELTATEPAPGS